jgi:Ca2+-binding EF-hand superfamily protein
MRINPALANQMYLNSGDDDSSCMATGTYSNLAAAKYIKENDKDGDKCLSADEVTLSAAAYAKLDADNDGKVTLDEMKESLAGKDDEIYQYYKNGGASSDTDITTELLSSSNSSTTSGTYSTLAAKRYLADKDENDDGVLSSEEVGLSSEIFTQMDANGDGNVTKAELQSVLSSQENTIMTYYKNGGTSSITDLTSRLLGTI